MNDLQDKQYLALELTKIAYSSTGSYEDKDIYESYKYYLNELTGLVQDITTVQELKKEIGKLQGLLKIATDNPEHGKKLHRLIDVVNQCKGDMEPYVYECLMTEINMKIQ